MKRIALIEPRAAGLNVFSGFPIPRLGLPIIGTILRDAGYDVRIYCEDLRPIHPTDYWHILGADLVGISITTSTAPRGYFLASLLRKAKKRVVIGGVHATFLPDEALEHADYCVRGEGEATMLELARALEDGGRLDEIAGLSFHAGAGVRHNPPRPLIKDIGTLPTPDLSLIAGHERIWLRPVVTSRGCPYQCNFCSVTPMFGTRYRCLDPGQAVAALASHEGRNVFIYDDNFTANKHRAKEILRLMIKRRIAPSWTAQTRVDVAKDPELVSLMRRARCRALCIGFESINPATLAAMNKKQSVEDVAWCIKTLHRAGINIHGMFVVGADTDDVTTVEETVAFAKTHRLDTVQFCIMTPLPGTPFFEQLESEGRIFSKDWALYDGHHVVFWPKKMSPIDLQLGAYHAMRKFYSYSHCLRAMWRFRFLTAILRTYGVRTIKQWTRSNRSYMERLKALARKVPAGVQAGLATGVNAARKFGEFPTIRRLRHEDLR